jgi:hypothetical protein
MSESRTRAGGNKTKATRVVAARNNFPRKGLWEKAPGRGRIYVVVEALDSFISQLLGTTRDQVGELQPPGFSFLKMYVLL